MLSFVNGAASALRLLDTEPGIHTLVNQQYQFLRRYTVRLPGCSTVTRRASVPRSLLDGRSDCNPEGHWRCWRLGQNGLDLQGAGSCI